jgi:hypothetical protein
MDQVFSIHFEAYFSFDSFKEAFENFYIPFCEEKSIEPELEEDDFNSLDLSDIEDDTIDAILINAKDYGFDIEEHKNLEVFY